MNFIHGPLKSTARSQRQFYTFQRPDNLAVSGVRADERVGPRRQIVISTRPLSQCPHNDVFTAIIYNKYFYFEPGRGCCPLFSSPGLSVVCRDLTQFVWSSRELVACGQLGVKIPACPRSFVINSHNCGSDTHKADAQIINNYVSNVRLLQTFCF